MVGTLDGRRVAFLPRHGRGHRILPHELNFRANVFAMKKLGRRVDPLRSPRSARSRSATRRCTWSCPTSSSTAPRQRKSTFFGRGLVAHVAFAHPFCRNLSKVMAEACAEAGATHHVGGTYVCMEGPQFSTRAESELYRSWGADLIGMTNLQEAKLAREAEICYSTLAMVTDYDCWHPDHDAVTAEQIMGASAGTPRLRAARAARRGAPAADPPRVRVRARALKYALVTAPELVPEASSASSSRSSAAT